MSTQALPNPLIGAVTAALPEGENDRIKKLLSYKVLDTDAETRSEERRVGKECLL